MSAPWQPMVIVAGLAVCAAAVDRAMRAGGIYLGLDAAWPARVFLRRAGGADAPYRAAAPTARVTSPAGVPVAVSVMLAPTALLSLAWTLCAMLAVGDLPAAFAGHRALGFALASLGWCVARAAVGWTSMGAAASNHRGAFAVLGVAALALDVTMATVAVPCSDVRADDVRVAHVGLVVQGLLAAGFAWSQWRRRGGLDAEALRAMQ